MIKEHGASKYSNDKCRCDICRAANSARMRKRRGERIDYVRRYGLPQVIKHGASAYHNWGCRCDVCAAGATARRDARKAVQ